MKKCKRCNGRGFVFGLINEMTNKTIMGFPVSRETGIKKTCPNCFGKGLK